MTYHKNVSNFSALNKVEMKGRVKYSKCRIKHIGYYPIVKLQSV